MTTYILGRIDDVEHAATSRNGNPTYRLKLDDGRTFLTVTDGGIGYAATNYRPRRHLGPADVVRLYVDGRGRVWDIRRAPGVRRAHEGPGAIFGHLPPSTLIVETHADPGWRTETRRAAAEVAGCKPGQLKRIGPDLTYTGAALDGRPVAYTFYRAR